MNVDGKVVFCQIRWRTRNLCNGVFLEVGRKQNTGMMLCEEDVLQPHMDGDVGMWSELEMRSGRPRKKGMQRRECCGGGLGLDLPRSA